jgi:prevent-host-death family protein
MTLVGFILKLITLALSGKGSYNIVINKEVALISAGIKDIKNNLSRLLVQVKAGKEIVITERGKPIARIVKEAQGGGIHASLTPLIESGLIVLPASSIRKDNILAVKASGKAASQIVSEDRR